MEWELPVVSLRTVVVLPRNYDNVEVGRPKSKRALEEAQAADNRVLLLVQKEPRIDDPEAEDLHKVGTLGVVKQVIRLPDDTLQVLVEGKERAIVEEFLPGSTMRARVRTIPESSATKPESGTQALVEEVKRSFSEYVSHNKNLRLDSFHIEDLRSQKEPGILADKVAKYSSWEVADKQAVLEEMDPAARLELVLGFLARDIERMDTEKQINARVKAQMDGNQREYYLREQMKAIQRELGNDEASETEELRNRVKEKELPEAAEERALKEIRSEERRVGKEE